MICTNDNDNNDDEGENGVDEDDDDEDDSKLVLIHKGFDQWHHNPSAKIRS